MIKQTLTTPHTFNELLKKLCHSHTYISLKIELDMMIEIGSVGFDNGKYFYIKCKNLI
jgi:hypothetical protein